MIIFRIKGGLGNQIFQYAAAYQYAKKHQTGTSLDLSFYDDIKFKDQFKLDKFRTTFDTKKLNHSEKVNSGLLSRFNQFMYKRSTYWRFPGQYVISVDSLDNCIWKLDNLSEKHEYVIEGWLQKTQFFKHVKEDLSDLLWLKPKYIPIKEITSRIVNSNSVAVHIRRGDMEKNSSFITLGRDYYIKALEVIKKKVENPLFFVFSDEPDKAKTLLNDITDLNYVTDFSEPMGYYGTSGDYIDFYLMRLCRHYIIANSTFSWWPAYLNNTERKVVISPEVWYNIRILQDRLLDSGLLVDNWIKL
jgi:hypothetical protein